MPAGSPNRAFTRRHHSVILNDVAVEPYIVRVLIHEKPGVDSFCGYYAGTKKQNAVRTITINVSASLQLSDTAETWLGRPSRDRSSVSIACSSELINLFNGMKSSTYPQRLGIECRKLAVKVPFVMILACPPR